MRRLIGTAILVLSPALALLPITHGSRPASAERPNLAAIFNGNGNYQQIADQFGTVSRVAFDASGHRIGVQIGRYDRGSPNGMSIEMTYLEPDAEHPQGRAFDGAGNPTPLH